MPKKMPKTPSYRKHKVTGQAVVTLGGKDFYLGLHGSKASKREYDRLISEWLANDRTLKNDGDDITITVLLAAYIRYAKNYYVRDGQLTREYASVKRAIKPVRKLYAKAEATDFGPLALKAVRQVLIDDGLSRKVINRHIFRIRAVFKWGASQELIPSGIYEALRTVSGLGRGRSAARETKKVRPVPDEHVDAIKNYVLPQVWAIIELQRITAARSGEVVIVRASDIDMTGKGWLYRPSSHKTEHHDHERIIDLGPRAQAVIRPFLKSDVYAFLFSPRDAIVEQHKNATVRRRENGISEYTIKREVGLFRSVIDNAVSFEWLSTNPVKAWPRFKPNARKEFLPRNHVEDLLASHDLDENEIEDLRSRMLLSVEDMADLVSFAPSRPTVRHLPPCKSYAHCAKFVMDEGSNPS